MPLSERIARLADRIGRVPRAYRAAFATDDGVVVLRDLAHKAGILEVSTHAGDPHVTSFNDGKKALFLHIVEKLRWNERDLLKLSEAAATANADAADGMDQSE